MPKLALRTMFGKCKRPERTYDQLKEKYETTLKQLQIKAPSEFEAEQGKNYDREELIGRFEDELKNFIKALSKWDEKTLSEYVLPHPAIGKCTMREFVYFTTLHTYHHLDILKNQYSYKS